MNLRNTKKLNNEYWVPFEDGISLVDPFQAVPNHLNALGQRLISIHS